MRTATLHTGDNITTLSFLPANSVDAVVTDPPYGLSREPDIEEVLRHWLAGDDYNHRHSGFMGKGWDSFVPGPSTWEAVLRVLKPGGYVLAFFGTRTYDLGVIAMRLAGFEIRDEIAWLYGSGFPKSHDAGQGRGTALKPAHEPIVLARKPLIGTVAANLNAHGTGALNIDACRIDSDSRPLLLSNRRLPNNTYAAGLGGSVSAGRTELGRWPANVVHDGCDEVLSAFPDAPGQLSKASTSETQRAGQNTYGVMARGSNGAEPRNDSGSAARFFYCAKASKSDRDEGVTGPEQPIVTFQTANGTSGAASSLSEGRETAYRNTHPTVKPTALMRWLVRLVTPPNGTVLDPFMGSGSTGKAAVLEGFDFIGCELDPAYVEIARQRIAATGCVGTHEGIFG